MKLFLTVLVALLGLAPGLLAQVTVEVTFEQDQYLANEEMIASVRIRNLSGLTLKLGKEEDWLRFSVESDNNYIVNKLADPPVVEEFELPSAGRATRRVDIAPYFNMNRPGRYRVVASVRIGQLQQELVSKAQGVNIMSGAKLWEQEFGVPGDTGVNARPAEVRKYALVQSNNKRQIRLYVRVTDAADNKTYRVFPIGPLISFSRPEAQIDRQGRLHVLFQTGARTFSYSVVTPDGDLIVRETHQYSNTRPSLRAEAEGKISVGGGSRVASPADLPQPAAPETAAASAPATPAASPKPAEPAKP